MAPAPASSHFLFFSAELVKLQLLTINGLRNFNPAKVVSSLFMVSFFIVCNHFNLLSVAKLAILFNSARNLS